MRRFFQSHQIFWCRSSVLILPNRTHTIFHSGATLSSRVATSNKSVHIFYTRLIIDREVISESCKKHNRVSLYTRKVNRLVSKLSFRFSTKNPETSKLFKSLSREILFYPEAFNLGIARNLKVAHQ